VVPRCGDFVEVGELAHMSQGHQGLHRGAATTYVPFAVHAALGLKLWLPHTFKYSTLRWNEGSQQVNEYTGKSALQLWSSYIFVAFHVHT